jgi:uncharacterized protein YuzE
MKERYLEITFRKGKPFAAYYYLPRKPYEKSVKTEKVNEGVLIDYGEAGQPIGIEITSPQKIDLHYINEILGRLNIAPIAQEEIAPLAVA